MEVSIALSINTGGAGRQSISLSIVGSARSGSAGPVGVVATRLLCDRDAGLVGVVGSQLEYRVRQLVLISLTIEIGGTGRGLWWCRTDVLSLIVRTNGNNIENY